VEHVFLSTRVISRGRAGLKSRQPFFEKNRFLDFLKSSFRPSLVLRVCIRDVMDFAASAARLVKFFKGRFRLFTSGV
jgi:hypothetical protein